MCDCKNTCIYYQDYAKRMRKNNMALARKYINNLKLEVERYKVKGINTLSEGFRNTLEKQLTDALKRKEDEYEQNFGKPLRFSKTQYPSLSKKECNCCLYRIEYAKREHKKAKRDAKFDKIAVVDDNYRNIPVAAFKFMNKKDRLKEAKEYHEKLLQEKYKK